MNNDLRLKKTKRQSTIRKKNPNDKLEDAKSVTYVAFNLPELLISAGIVALLVAISVPIFVKQLEKSREAADIANARCAYAEIMVEVEMENKDKTVTFDLMQTKEGWQSLEEITIGGISHGAKEGDTIHWSGIPQKGGTCRVSYVSEDTDQDGEEDGIKFEWLSPSVQ